MWLMSSRLMMAPSRRASRNSSAGVSLEVNMMSSPVMPDPFRQQQLGQGMQSAPKPSSFRISRMYGFGRALTAKYLLKPSKTENARLSSRAFSRMARSS